MLTIIIKFRPIYDIPNVYLHATYTKWFKILMKRDTTNIFFFLSQLLTAFTVQRNKSRCQMHPLVQYVTKGQTAEELMFCCFSLAVF